MDERIFDMATRRVGRAVSRRGALAGLSALAAALPLGVRAKNGQDDRPDRADGPDSAKKKKCKPAKCPAGCCSGKKCKPGTAVDACGTGGAACMACAFGEMCIGGACVEACSPANCWGCCDPVTNACRGGTSPEACGTGGAACSACSAGEACPSGTCEALCSPATCAGCCDPVTNACSPGTTSAACGMGGAACAACAGDAFCCVAGACAAGTWTNRTTFASGPGNGPAQVDTPMGVAVTGDERTVLIADGPNDRVSVWQGAGTPVAWSPETTFGSAGVLPNQFNYPVSVAVAADGLTAWVTDLNNHRVAVWMRPSAASTAWAIATTFGTTGPGLDQFQQPFGVAVSPDLLTAWVSDYANQRVSVWTRPGVSSNAWTWQASFGSGPGAGPSQFTAPSGLGVTADGLTVLVADQGNSRVSVWTRPSASSIVWSNQATFGAVGAGDAQLSLPQDVAVSPDGTMAWVADTGNNRVSIWTRPDAASAAWSPDLRFGSVGAGASQFQWPTAIAVAADGRTAWIDDRNNSRISVWAETCP